MIRKFHGIDVEIIDDQLERVLDNADDLPDYEALDDDLRLRVREQLTEDDYALDVLTLREAAYERSEAVPEHVDPHGEGTRVLEREVFRAAEWLDSSLRLYVRSQIERARRDDRDDTTEASDEQDASTDEDVTRDV